MKPIVKADPPDPTFNPWKVVCLFLGLATALTAIGYCLSGCSLARYVPLQETVAGITPEPDPCESLDDSYIGWTITAAIAGTGATATTAAAAAITDHDAIVGLGIASIGLAAVATAAGLVAAEYAARYEACRSGTGEW